MDRTWVLLLYEWKLMARHRLLLFLGLPVIGAFLLSKYGLFLILPASAMILGIPRTGKMFRPRYASVAVAASSMLGVQAAIYCSVLATLNSAPGIWIVLPALAVSLAITAGRLHGR